MFQCTSEAKMNMNEYVGKGDAMLCLDVNIWSRRGTYFLQGAPCSALLYPVNKGFFHDCVMWKEGFVAPVMAFGVSNAGMKTSMCYFGDFQWEVELFCLYSYPMDDLFPCQLKYTKSVFIELAHYSATFALLTNKTTAPKVLPWLNEQIKKLRGTENDKCLLNVLKSHLPVYRTRKLNL